MEIRKNKNFVEFTENDKVVKFDINNGEFIGVSGRPTKAVPVQIREIFSSSNISYCGIADNNIVKFLQIVKDYGKIKLNTTNYLRTENALKIMSLLDRIESAGIKLNGHSIAEYVYGDREDIDFFSNHFTELIKWYNENNYTNYYLKDFLDEITEITVRNLINTEMIDHLTDQMMKSIIKIYRNRLSAELKTATNLNRIANYYIRGLWDYHNGDAYAIDEKISDLIRLCFVMREDLPKGDFFKGYIDIKRRYETRKAEFDAKAIAKNQNAHRNALTFEDENLTVIIPMTSAEFIEEGERQNNCVARLYLPKVISGETNVVFIREKSNPTKNYITCEVKNGEIIQYLHAHNSYRMSDIDNIFKDAYEKHLRNTWGE